MKNLSEVLDQIPQTHLQPGTSLEGAGVVQSQASPLDLSEDAINAYLASIATGAQSRRAIKDPLSPQLLFRFCCLGLAGAALLGAMFIAWLYRPVNAMAQADAMRQMGDVVSAMAVEVVESKPQDIKCPLIGSCKVEPQQQRPGQQPQQPQQPMGNQWGSPAIAAEVSNFGVPIPTGTTQGPNPDEIYRAKMLIHQWVNNGSNSISIKDFLFQIANGQIYDPSFPHPKALEIAYTQYFGVTY
ncbi:MAG: hypothetical protein HC771_22410 [Synechococcales cyanobacterium CRU_2_2]|nr:hypothetical protein [Synechococcales cyanobacterium CRU_2_2]